MEKPVMQAKAISKSALVVLLNTGANETKLADVGFDREFQRETGQRVVTLDHVKKKPSSKDEAGYGNWCEVKIKGSIVSFGVIATADESFRMMHISTQQNVYFTVVSGKKVWTFIVEGTAQDVRGAIRTMFNDSLLRGPKAYDRNNAIIPSFWQKALELVYPEATIIEIGLRNKAQQYVPSRVYFHPKEPARNTLASGGYCYHLDLDVFPREQINKGTGLWSADERKKNESRGVVNIGMLQVKPGNKEKKEQREKAPVIDLKLGNSGRGWLCAHTEEGLKAAVAAPEVVKQPKAKPVAAAPVKQEQKKKASK